MGWEEDEHTLAYIAPTNKTRLGEVAEADGELGALGAELLEVLRLVQLQHLPERQPVCLWWGDWGERVVVD